MLKQALLVMIIIMSIFTKDNLMFSRFFLAFALSYYLNKKKFNFRYWLFTHLVFVGLLIYSCFTMWKGEFIGMFGAGFKIEGHRKLLFIGLYFFTICNIYIHYLSKDLRKSIEKKTGQYGPRGNRGLRGKSGKPSSCEGGCGDSLCYKKMLSNITLVYNKYCDQKGLEKLPEDKFIANNFIKRKCKVMCESDAMKDMLSAKGAKECYKYVFDAERKHGVSEVNLDGYPSIWRQWIELILKYENGKDFLDSEYLTDNDFDYMITPQDYKYFCEDNSSQYSDFCFIDEETKGKKVISPFDEIKKYDLWYWGSPISSRPKYVEKCSYIDSEGKIRRKHEEPELKMVNSNLYRPVWRSRTSRQSLTSVGSLDNNGICQRELQYVPDKQAGNNLITIYRSEDFHTHGAIDYKTYKPLGDATVEGDSICHNRKSLNTVPFVDDKDNNLNEPININDSSNPLNPINLVAGPSVKKPKGYKRIFKNVNNDRKSFNKSKFNYSIWRPIPPNDDYVCLGDIFNNNVSDEQPSRDLVACVPRKCVRPQVGMQEKNIWNSRNRENADTQLSSCGKEREYTESGAKRDISDKYGETDNIRNANIDIYRNPGTNLFRAYKEREIASNKEPLYEIIPSGEPGSCLDVENLDKSRFANDWVVPKKHPKKYSIQKIYDE